MESGYLVPEQNDEELAKGIQYLIDNPQVLECYTEKARRVIEEKFDLNKQLIEQQTLYSLLELIHEP
jgi:glycosyltransferase involved in cell wall biosynthesis